MASMYSKRRMVWSPSPQRISTARISPFSRSVGALAIRSSGVGARRSRAFLGSVGSMLVTSGWL